jgi:alkylation response protein AidB-like acyl-CoA dehydrogenase
MTCLIPRRDIDFLLAEWLNIESLFDLSEFSEHSTETVAAVLDLAERLAEETFLPHNKESDRVEPRLDADGVHILAAIHDALRQYGELGLFSMGFSPELGGMGLPYLACAAAFAQFAAAIFATAAYPMLTVANARLIASFGSKRQIDFFALPQIEGRWFGTMCLSEPQAGSGLGDVATRAAADGEDEFGARYRLTGNKMWISGGDQDASENIVHLVLAKAPGPDGKLPEGTKGISLFIVPKILPDGARNDVIVAGLNHKMGYRGTANCLLNLGEKGGAIGWRVGKEGDGLRQMFLMMNEARIGVGIGAAALGYRGYRHSVDYARQRTQGRLVGVSGGKPVAIIEHPDVRHMLLAQKVYAEGALALCLYAAKLVDEGDASAALLGLLTPIAKTWPSEYGLAANDLAIQVHGGYGYTRDFDVEQLYRDNRLNPIHEGTTGIQGIDLMGRKILRDNGEGLAILSAKITATANTAATYLPLQPYAAALQAALAQVHETIESLRGAEGARAYDNATFFLRAFGHVALGWLWLDQAALISGLASITDADRNFYNGKLAACRYFFETELPRASAWLGFVGSRTDVAFAASPDIF